MIFPGGSSTILFSPSRRNGISSVPSLKRTLLHEFPTAGLRGIDSRRAGRRSGDLLLGREWQREGGTTQRMARAFVDASWGELTDTVYNFCARSKYANILLPSHGMFVGAGSRPFSDYQKKQGDRVGLNWRVPQKGVKRDQRHLLYDANFWKSFIYARFRVSLGDPGSLSLFGESSETHRMFSEHLHGGVPNPDGGAEPQGRRVAVAARTLGETTGGTPWSAVRSGASDGRMRSGGDDRAAEEEAASETL